MATNNVMRNIHFPPDWLALIDRARGDADFAHFVRECVRLRLAATRPDAARKLSPNPTRRKARAAS